MRLWTGIPAIVLTSAIALGKERGHGADPSPLAPYSILTFAQRFKGLYRSEIRDEAPFSSVFNARFTVPYVEASYDDRTHTIKVNNAYLGVTHELQIMSACTETGSGIGTTAMGVTVPFTKRTCDYVFIDMPEGWLGSTKRLARHPLAKTTAFKGDPGQFRDIQEHGLEIQVMLTPIKPKGVIVRYEEGTERARIDRPYETYRRVYRLHARIHQIDYFFVGSKAPFKTDRFD